MGVQIAVFLPKHAAAAAKLERVCFTAPWSEEILRQESKNSSAVMLCALDDQNRLLGWAGFEHVCGEGSITNVAVEPASRRSGIGQALVVSLIKEAEKLSLECLILEVRVSNSAAIALYNKLGFVSLGVRPGFYEAPREDALMMRITFLKGRKLLKILAIETSCDETAVAVVENKTRVLSSVVRSQIKEHGMYGGVVPEIASRRHVESISAIVKKALDDAGETIQSIDAVAVTAGPGLVGALLVGVNFAKGLALAADKPLIPVHHIRGHIAACYLADAAITPPFLCLAVSGGHSHIIAVEDYTTFRVLGRTRDDAAGEAFDKAARAMGLGYPGGPAIQAAAALSQDDNKYRLPSPKVEGHPLDFSFSGLKTSVVNLLHNAGQKCEPIDINALAATFERVICEALIGRLVEAAQKTGMKTVAIAGGVSANIRLRRMLTKAAAENDLSLCLPPLWLTGDNAAMIATQAFYELEAGNIAGDALNAVATLSVDYKTPAVFEV